jgi:hypothetical protein
MNKKFELLRESVGCYKANHVSGDVNEKALLEFIDELEQLTIPVVVGQSERLKAVEKLKDFAYEVCPLHREDDLEEIVGSL